MGWLTGAHPNEVKPKPPAHNPIVKSHMNKKPSKVYKRGYMQSGYIQILIIFFAVPKDISDICMVYDMTAIGFNRSVWAPKFGLPNV